jgi:hypothetical protein
MSLLLMRGVAKLSQLEIDANKDWQSREITNLKTIAGAMGHGDIAFRGAGVLENLAADAGKGYNFLRSRGPGLSPVWQDIESLIQFMTEAANRALAFDVSVPIPALCLASIVTPGGEASSAPVLSVPAPGITGETSGTSTNAVGGAVSHNHDVGDTDETVQANDPALNDMTLLPADGAINDHYTLGFASQFDAVCMEVGTAGANYSLAYEYSKGAGVWGTLTILHNSTSEWKSAGKGWLTFARPTDWAPDTLAGLTLYWIRARVTSVGVFTQPKGNQAWILIYS